MVIINLVIINGKVSSGRIKIDAVEKARFINHNKHTVKAHFFFVTISGSASMAIEQQHICQCSWHKHAA